jgi:hypothetical protein
MSDDTRPGEQREESAGVSRRKFLERTATAGGVAAIVGAAAHRRSRAGEAQTESAERGGETPQRARLRGEMVEYKSGDLMIPAFLSRPKTRRVAPGSVLVIHEVFGLNDHIKSIADRISGEGFVALAPDLFVRAPEPPPKDASDTAALTQSRLEHSARSCAERYAGRARIPADDGRRSPSFRLRRFLYGRRVLLQAGSRRRQ